MVKKSPSEVSGRPDKGVSDVRYKSTAKRASFLSQFTSRRATNKPLQHAAPLTKDDQRIAANKTARLIDSRCQLDKALQAESTRDIQNFSDDDRVERGRLLAKNTKLEKNEEKHLRNLVKARKESKRLYGRDPTPQRAGILDFTEDLLRQFKRHLVPSLNARDSLLQCLERAFEHPDDNSSFRPNADQDGDCDALKPSESASQAQANKPKVVSDDALLTNGGQSPPSIDCSLENPVVKDQFPKRKLDQDPPLATSEKKKQKIAKSEATQVRAQQMATSELPTPDDTASSVSSNEDSGLDKSGKYGANTGTSGPKQPQSVVQPNKESNKDDNASKGKGKIGTLPTIEPWYMGHARAMMEPDFNDCVFYRARKKQRRGPVKDYAVSGALVINAELLTPPPSASSSSSEGSKQSHGHNRQNRPHGRDNKHRHRKGRKFRGGH